MPYKYNPISGQLDYYEAGAPDPNLYAKGSYNNFYKSSGYAFYSWPVGTLFYQDMTVLSEVTVDAIRFQTQTSLAGQMSFTLYSATDAGLPDQKIVEVTFDTSTPAGVQIITFADKVLPAGNYFWALQSNSPIWFWYTLNKENTTFAFLGRNANNEPIANMSKTYAYTTPTPTTAPAPDTITYGNTTTQYFVQTRIKI